jgi:hypothetical protein
MTTSFSSADEDVLNLRDAGHLFHRFKHRLAVGDPFRHFFFETGQRDETKRALLRHVGIDVGFARLKAERLQAALLFFTSETDEQPLRIDANAGFERDDRATFATGVGPGARGFLLNEVEERTEVGLRTTAIDGEWLVRFRLRSSGIGIRRIEPAAAAKSPPSICALATWFKSAPRSVASVAACAVSIAGPNSPAASCALSRS